MLLSCLGLWATGLQRHTASLRREREAGRKREVLTVRKPLPHSSTPRKGLTSDEGCLSQFARREDRGAEKKGRSAAR
jgi:hypothetical protein